MKEKSYEIEIDVDCMRRHCCKNYGLECDHCYFNESLPKMSYEYKSTVKCRICGNENVIQGYRCKNCGEDVY